MANEFDDVEISISNFKCFGADLSWWKIRPINVIIGRNNAGKSALIDAIEVCATSGKFFDAARHQRGQNSFRIDAVQTLTLNEVEAVFPQNMSGGSIGGNHFQFGQKFTNRRLHRSFGPGWNIKFENPAAFPELNGKLGIYANNLAQRLPWPFNHREVLRVSAERNVGPELRSTSLNLAADGEGVTNVIRAFINRDDLPRDEVEVGLLSDLNEIYAGDSTFTRISCRESDGEIWEIFLHEAEKGEIRLSQSGSSLKSIFIILAFLRLYPLIANRKNWKGWSKQFFAIEEPENNLHPALLRRLLNFLAAERSDKEFVLLLTTHSPVGIDWSSVREDSQILHIQSNNGTSRLTVATDYLLRRSILDDLDIRASDMLQSNVVIWVEGPSDRIYLRKWLELASNGKLREGVHYSVMFYGGKLLSHLDMLSPTEGAELISLLSINRNAAIIIDSDRRNVGGKTSSGRVRKPRMNINATKQRIREEVELMNGFVWVTAGKEIENYISHPVLQDLASDQSFAPDEYADIPSHNKLAKFKKNKIELAHSATEAMTEQHLDRLDLKDKITALATRIADWNHISI